MSAPDYAAAYARRIGQAVVRHLDDPDVVELGAAEIEDGIRLAVSRALTVHATDVRGLPPVDVERVRLAAVEAARDFARETWRPRAR